MKYWKQYENIKEEKHGGFYYCTLGSVSTLTKQIIIFFKKWFKKNRHYTFFHHLLYYCNEIIHNVDYDNFDNFQHVNFIFSQNLISLFWGLFSDETELRVKVSDLVLYSNYRAQSSYTIPQF
jgi:hypothetical protein